jgi:hypothetical protein
MTLGRRLIIAVLALSLGLTGCIGARQQDADRQRSTEPGGAPEQPQDSAALRSGEEGAAPAAQAPPDQAARAQEPEPLPPIPPGSPGNLAGSRVIKNATVQIEVPKDQFEDRFDKANALPDQFGGFVAGNSTRETKGRVASGSVTLRVPSDKFQAAVSALRKLGRVTEENQRGEDVSQEFVDLEARLRHAKTQEAFYLRLMDRAANVSELIQIQEGLSGVQRQIEEIQGRLEYLKDQTSFSTITVRLFEPGVARPVPRGALGRAWAQAVDGFKSVIGGVIVLLGWLAPLGILAGLGFLIFKLVRRPKATPAA